MISLFRNLFSIILSIGILLLLTSCAPHFFSEDKILEILSERYGTEFILIETLEDNLPCKPGTVNSKLYAVAPNSEPTDIFWVQQKIVKHGGIFVSYGRTVDDTLACDCFIKQFDVFLQEEGIHFLFEKNDVKTDILEYLSQPHTRGGDVIVFLTKDTAKDIVSQVFNFIECFYEKCSNDELKRILVTIYFCDESKENDDEIDKMGMPCFFPYDSNVRDGNMESVLADINKSFYE